MNRLLPTLSLTALFLVPAARAATFEANFNSGLPAEITVQGDPDVTKVVATGGVNNSGYLQLTDNQNDRSGSAIIADLNNGQPIGGFTATMKVRVGGGTARPADGFSFVWGDDVPDSTFGEDGAGSGLSISLDTYDNNGSDTAPSIDVKFGGTADSQIIATAYADGQREANRPRPNYASVLTGAGGKQLSLDTGTNWVTLRIAVHPTGTLDLSWGDLVVFTNLPIPNFQPQTARFGFGARTGGANENHWIDDLSITTEATVPDTTKPVITNVQPGRDLKSLTVTFSKSLEQTAAETAGNYALNGGATVTKATLKKPWVVVLDTSSQTANTGYSLTVNNLKDLANNSIAANTKSDFTAFAPAVGFLTVDYFNNLTGTAITDLTGNDLFPNGYDDTRYIGEFATYNSYSDNYGARVSGFLTPEVTGDYYFYLRSDDASQLFLSTNETPPDPLTAAPIAEENGCCQAFLEPDNTLAAWHDNGSGVGQTTLTPIHLEAGKKYAVLALLKEGTGGDYLQVAWKLKESTAAASSLTPISGKNLLTYAAPGGTVTISKQPASVTVVAGKTASFSVEASGNPPALAYQWMRNGTNIPGATAATYTTPLLAIPDSGAKYTVEVSVPGKAVTSSEAILTVPSDNIPPAIQVGSVKNGSNYDVGVQFDEQVDATSAGTQSNYSISAGTITGFKFYPASPGVVLTVSGLTEGSKYSVTVKNVADRQGNAITSASKEFTAGKMTWGVVGADELQKGNGVVAVGENGFDIYSDSIGEWATYDEATFAYEQVTGDFDKKLRVEYQDASSQWARAGLVARDVLNFGVDRATQEGGAAGRYQKVHVNPVGPTLTGPGTAGNGSWEGNRRLAAGAATTSAGGSGTPKYPNAWCRLQRKGDVFTIYRSDDGVEWTSMGTTTFDEPMPATLFVGPEYAPENGNITNESDRGVFLAKFRDYGDYTPGGGGGEPTLTFARTSSTALTLTFQGGRLQSATKVGPGADWQDVAGAASPYNANTSTGTLFYRVIGQ